MQDLFTPEIDSDAPTLGAANDWTTDNALTEHDSYKVRAVINEIDGLDHSGTTKVGTPAIFGMNLNPWSLQAVQIEHTRAHPLRRARWGGVRPEEEGYATSGGGTHG